ncbi:hypothetical protein F66182_9682 [Fusarium sp. NRRL 66182]|nr:hypothetical protein F66182_9682 [Fusarium sp. NRRL 66182]
MTNTNREVLVAAFTFGLVVHAGTAAVFLLINNRASKIVRDAPRLALIVFLVSSALWAQIEFSAFLLEIDSKSGCQIMITFASMFDQFARVSMQQSLLWILSTHSLASLAEIAVAQGFLLLRLILGGVFVGVQRPQLDTVCLTQTSILPIGITVSVVDTAFVAFLLIRVISRGVYSDAQEGVINSSQSRAIALVVLGLIIWTGASAPLMLSIRPMAIVVRTTAPSIGLLILIGLLALFRDRLFCRDSSLIKPTKVPDLDYSKDLHTRRKPAADILGSSRHHEFTREIRGGSTGTSKPLPTPAATKRGLPLISRPAAGQANVGMGGVPVLGQLFPLPRTQTLLVSPETGDLETKRVQRPTAKGTALNTNALSRSSTEAEILDPVISTDYGKKRPGKERTLVTSRSEGLGNTAKPADTQHSSLPSDPTVAITTSAFLSPVPEEIRRRSPRQSPAPSPSPALSLFPRPSPLRLQARPSPKATGDTIVNFSLPVEARPSRLQHQLEHEPPKSAPLVAVPRNNAKEIVDKREDAARTLSMVHRPRPIPRKPNMDRAIFPAEGSPNLHHHKRALSCGSLRLKQPFDDQAGDGSSRLDELSSLVAKQANVLFNTRRRSRSMSELPALPISLGLMSIPDKATLPIKQTDALTTIASIPGSSVSVETAAQSPTSPERSHDQQVEGFRRRSSPIIPVEDPSALSPLTIRDEDFGIGSSLRSPATHIHVQRALPIIVTAKNHSRSGLGVTENSLPPENQSRKGRLVVHKPSAKANVGPGPELRYAEALQTTAERQQQVRPLQVGETCPTFSDRGYSIKPRRSIPPAPLLLRRTDNVLSEPSPVESEDGLVETAQHDFDSPRLRIPSYQIPESDRLALLTNLELELNEQEHQWHAVRHTMLGRDSLSTVETSPSRESRHGSLRQSFLGAKFAQRAQYEADNDLAALYPQTDLKSKSKLVTSSTFPRFTASLGNHTPPDSDEEREYDEDHGALIGQTQDSPAKAAMVMWRPIVSAAVAPSATRLSLWTPASKPWVPVKEIATEDDTAVSVRRPVRKNEKPLVIESSSLWRKPEPKDKTSSTCGLWQQPSSLVKTQVVEVQIQQSRTRTVPRNPPRRIKRVTLLPDILESPKPLPDRRGTLGIFQFPSGDRSDCATIPAAATPLSVNGTMMNAGVAVDWDGVMQSNGSVFDMDDYEQDDESYYDDSSETYDSEDEDFFEPVVHQNTPREIPAPHEDEINSLLVSTRTDNAPLKHSEVCGSGSDRGSDSDSEEHRTSLRETSPQARDGDGQGRGDCSTKAESSPTFSAMTLTDIDLREHIASKSRIRVRQGQIGSGSLRARQPLFGGEEASISSQSLSVRRMEPHMSRCLLMNMDQAWAGAPINDSIHTHGTPKSIVDPCTDVEIEARGAPGAGHPQALLLFCFLEGSISKLAADADADADADLDYSMPNPLPLNPLVIYKSETPTCRQQTLVVHLLHSPPSPAFLSLLQPNKIRTTEHSTSMALWTPSAPTSRPCKGLPQPDNSIWNTYLSTDEPARVLPAMADLPILESNSLWTAPAKKTELSNFGLWGTKQPLPGMWTHSPIYEKPSYGLAQPDAETWATYLIVMDDAPRVKPREAQVAQIDSNSLWTAPIPVISETPSEDGLWSGSNSASSVDSSEPSTPREAVNFGLWEPLPAIIAFDDKEPTGLFSLSHKRTDYRTTKMMPAALDMERSPRRPLEAFPDFGITRLWNMAPLWDAKANAAAVKLQRELDSLVLEGMFSLNHRRNNFRTTSEPPAALETRPKPRISQQSLPKLDSDSLWSVRAPNQDATDIDWITLSTVRPRESSVVSLTDSEDMSSPPVLTRASSINSEAEKTARPTATPTQWLAALHEAIKLGSGKGVKALVMDVEDPGTLDGSDNYQLWSKASGGEPAIASDGDEMWKPSVSASTSRFLELTPALSEFDKLHAESGTSHRGRTQKSRPPLPMYPGSSSSAFLPGASDTPRDFSAQALWGRTQSPAPGTREDKSWIDKSLRKRLSFVQMW